MRIASSDLFRVIVYWITMVSNFEGSHASCTYEAAICREAVLHDRLGSLPGGGKCMPQDYFPYTHVCTVSHYLPSINYCCCAHEENIMCCRYSQTWDRFRCSETDDTIGTMSSSTPSEESLPLEILLPAILGPIAVLLCCVVCCVKCWCYRYEDEGDCMCCCPDDKKKEKELEKRLPYPPGHYLPTEERMPLTCGPRYSSSPSEGSNSKLMNHCNGVGHMTGDPTIHIEPTAPPLNYEDPWPHRASVCISHGNCNHGNRNSQHCVCATSQPAPPPCLSNCAACKVGGSHHGGYCCHIANAHVFEHQRSHDGQYPTCAPPGYDDAVKDELVSVPATSQSCPTSASTTAPDPVIPLGRPASTPASCCETNTNLTTDINMDEPSIYPSRPTQEAEGSSRASSSDSSGTVDTYGQSHALSDNSIVDDALRSVNPSALP